MSDAKADQLMDEGEKRLTKFAPFTSADEKAEKAREKFLQAGTQYKAAGSWLRAAAAYMRAADMSTRLKTESDFVADCEEAAKAYKKGGDAARAGELFMQVVDMYDRAQRYGQAAKYCEALAQQSEGREAVEWMQKAARYLRQDNSKTSANDVVLKTADLHLRTGDYDEARRIFEKQAKDALDDRLQRGGARKLFFNALLCMLADLQPTSIAEGISQITEKFQEYQDLDTQFTEHTREHMLIRDLIVALEEQDVEKFEEAVADYENICPLDDKRAKMLLRAKHVLRGGDMR